MNNMYYGLLIAFSLAFTGMAATEDSFNPNIKLKITSIDGQVLTHMSPQKKEAIYSRYFEKSITFQNMLKDHPPQEPTIEFSLPFQSKDIYNFLTLLRAYTHPNIPFTKNDQSSMLKKLSTEQLCTLYSICDCLEMEDLLKITLKQSAIQLKNYNKIPCIAVHALFHRPKIGNNHPLFFYYEYNDNGDGFIHYIGNMPEESYHGYCKQPDNDFYVYGYDYGRITLMENRPDDWYYGIDYWIREEDKISYELNKKSIPKGPVVIGVSFNHNGDIMAAASEDTILIVKGCNEETKKEAREETRIEKRIKIDNKITNSKITSIALNSQGNLIACTLDDGTIQIIDAETNKQHNHVTHKATAVSFGNNNNNNSIIIVALDNHIIQVVDIETKQVLSTTRCIPHNQNVLYGQFSHKGDYLCYTETNGRSYVQQWNTSQLIDFLYISQIPQLKLLKELDDSNIPIIKHIQIFDSLPISIQRCYTLNSYLKQISHTIGTVSKKPHYLKAVAWGLGLTAAAYGIYKYGFSTTVPQVN